MRPVLVDGRRVSIPPGGADGTVPASTGRWLADRIPGSEYTFWPQHGHFSWMIHDEAADVVSATATGF